jgi:hypothetical protein
MKSINVFLAAVSILVIGSAIVLAQSDPVYFGPTPYLSSDDIPEGFYDLGGPEVLADFEDGLPHPVMSGCIGGPFGPSPTTDSVDADDGDIDGLGIDGISWNVPSTGLLAIYFSPPLPTAAGIVWTDGTGGVSFEAWDPNHDSLGIFGPFDLDDGFNNGGTAEDRFFGVQNLDGILRIDLIGPPTEVMEADHVQYGNAGSVVAVPDRASVSRLNQNVPNPFNPQTTIRYELARNSVVDLRIFDLAGHLVTILEMGEMRPAGPNSIIWTGRDSQGEAMPSGTYFYCLEAGEFTETKRMTLIR